MTQSPAARLPTVASLATLAELTARCTAAPDIPSIAAILSTSAKWVVPAHHVSLVVRDGRGGFMAWPAGTSIVPVHALALALERRTTVTTGTIPPEVAPLAVPGITTWLVVPLFDGAIDVIGALILGARAESYLTTLDSGVLHLLALNVASAVRMAELLTSERSAVQSRDAMVATVVHDLRNPLAAASALVEMMLEDQPTGSMMTSDLVAVLHSLESMGGLAEEMLDAARAAAGHAMTLRRTVGDLGALLSSALAQVQRNLRSGFSLQLDLSSEPLPGSFDASRVRRVFDNLLSNAMKYSRPGGQIRVHSGRAGPMAVVEVADAGIGIPAADLPNVFKRFHRAGNVGTIRGTGLGLAGAAEIAQAHGGYLTVESIEGVGSTFRLALPL